MSGITAQVLFTVCLLCSCNIADLYKDDNQNEEFDTVYKSRSPSFDGHLHHSEIDSNLLPNEILEDLKLDKFYQYKTAQSVSPFENSHKEIKPLNEVSEDEEISKESKYVVGSEIHTNDMNQIEQESQIFKAERTTDGRTESTESNTINTYSLKLDNIGSKYSSDVQNYTNHLRNDHVVSKDIIESDDFVSLTREDIFTSESGIESNAQAFLTVNNVTVDQFYENRGNKSFAQYETEINQLLQDNSDVLVGEGKFSESENNKNVTDTVEFIRADSEEDIKHLDDFIFHATKIKENYNKSSGTGFENR